MLALAAFDSVAALDRAQTLSTQHVKGTLSEAINKTIYMYASENEFDSLAARFENFPSGNAKYMLVQPFANFLKRVKNTANFEKGIDLIVSLREATPEEYRPFVLPFLNGMILKGIATAKQSSGMTEQADYVNSKLPVEPKAKESPKVP